MTRRGRTRAAVFAATVLAWIAPPFARPACADGDHRLTWTYRRFAASEQIYTAAAWTSFLELQLFVKPPPAARWRGGVLFDEAARGALRLRTRRGRAIAGVVSDVLWITTDASSWAEAIVVPLAFDHGNTDVAFQMAMLNFEAFGPVSFASRFGHRFAGRERPSHAECAKDPTYEPYCGRRDLETFPSGHAATSFVAAGLSCAHHTHLPLYGGGVADDAACAGMLTMATTTALLRIMADRHYASDVIVGAMLGLGVGYGAPVLLHYDVPRGVASAPATTRSAGLSLVRFGWSTAF